MGSARPRATKIGIQFGGPAYAQLLVYRIRVYGPVHLEAGGGVIPWYLNGSVGVLVNVHEWKWFITHAGAGVGGAAGGSFGTESWLYVRAGGAVKLGIIGSHRVGVDVGYREYGLWDENEATGLGTGDLTIGLSYYFGF